MLAPKMFQHRSQIAAIVGVVTILSAAPAALSAAVLPVTTLADTDAADGDCSLREAIVAANTDAAHQECPAGSGADEIEIGVAGTIALAADLPQITSALTMRGLGAAESAIDGGGAFEILHLTDAAPGNGELLRVEALLLTGGSAPEGGAIYAGRNRALEVVDCVLFDNQTTLGGGGAIGADRTVSVTVERSSVNGNTSAGAGGGMAVQDGAVTVIDSTFAGNQATGGAGGGIYLLLGDSAVIRHSTLSGNQAVADGGGIASVSGPLRLELSTVTGNLADTDSDDDGDGGGVSVAGAVTGTLAGSLVAGNGDLSPAGGVHCPDGQRKLGAALLTEGFNLVGANDCFTASFPPGQPNVNGDQVGTAAAPIDALLSPLDDHGGPTFTHLPLPGSPAIDQGSCPGAAADQRGFGDGGTLLRIVDDPAVADAADGCDSGAVEVNAVDLATLVFLDGFESGDLSRWSASVP